MDVKLGQHFPIWFIFKRDIRYHNRVNSVWSNYDKPIYCINYFNYEKSLTKSPCQLLNYDEKYCKYMSYGVVIMIEI